MLGSFCSMRVTCAKAVDTGAASRNARRIEVRREQFDILTLRDSNSTAKAGSSVIDRSSFVGAEGDATPFCSLAWRTALNATNSADNGPGAADRILRALAASISTVCEYR